MALVEYLPFIVADPVTKEIRADLFGAEVTIVEFGTDTPVTGLVEARSGAALSNPVSVSATGYGPWMAKEDGPTRLDAVSGDFRTPIWSPSGLEAYVAALVLEAAASAAAAQEALTLADVQALVAGENVTFTATAEGLVISATGGSGTAVNLGWGTGQAAPGTEALRRTGTTTSQTVDGPVVFGGTVGFNAGAIAQAAINGLVTALAGKQPKARHIDVYYSPTTGWPNPTRTGDEFRRFDSVDYIDAPVPPMVARDRWLAHPESQVYIDRIAGPVTL